MIGRSDHFSDIVCPFDEKGCSRPYCHFWHSKEESVWKQQTYLGGSIPILPPTSPFMGYVGYVGNEVRQQVNGYDELYQPSNGYVGSIASTRNISENCSNKERLKRRIPSPLEPLSKPKLPAELPVEDILDPCRDLIRKDEKLDEALPKKKGNEVA